MHVKLVKKDFVKGFHMPLKASYGIGAATIVVIYIALQGCWLDKTMAGKTRAFHRSDHFPWVRVT